MPPSSRSGPGSAKTASRYTRRRRPGRRPIDGFAVSCARGAGVGDCRTPGEGFEFLGYRFEAGRRFVRKKSLNKLKDSIRNKTRRTCGKSLTHVIADLNPMLRGWFGYFKQAYRTTFKDLDGFIRRRLRSLLLKQNKRTHAGFSRDVHRLWPNAYFANAELFALHTAWQSARRPR